MRVQHFVSRQANSPNHTTYDSTPLHITSHHITPTTHHITAHPLHITSQHTHYTSHHYTSHHSTPTTHHITAHPLHITSHHSTPTTHHITAQHTTTLCKLTGGAPLTALRASLITFQAFSSRTASWCPALSMWSCTRLW